MEWRACAKIGLIHHVLVAIHESVMVLRQIFKESRQAFPEVPTRSFGSPGYTPPSWSGAVQGLTQHFEQMSMRGGTHTETKSFLDEASEEVWWEYYTGRHFAVPELVPGVDRHHETKLKLNALGGEFLWTLNHEIVFSTAMTGRPKRKAFFSQYCWKRCAVGTTKEYDLATNKKEWEISLMRGDLYGLQTYETKRDHCLVPIQ